MSEHVLAVVVAVNANGTVDLNPVGATGSARWPSVPVGGYAQLSYGFNYYGTIGTNRDEIVVVRKMVKVDWLDTPATTEPALDAQQA